MNSIYQLLRCLNDLLALCRGPRAFGTRMLRRPLYRASGSVDSERAVNKFAELPIGDPSPNQNSRSSSLAVFRGSNSAGPLAKRVVGC